MNKYREPWGTPTRRATKQATIQLTKIIHITIIRSYSLSHASTE